MIVARGIRGRGGIRLEDRGGNVVVALFEGPKRGRLDDLGSQYSVTEFVFDVKLVVDVFAVSRSNEPVDAADTHGLEDGDCQRVFGVLLGAVAGPDHDRVVTVHGPARKLRLNLGRARTVHGERKSIQADDGGGPIVEIRSHDFDLRCIILGR